MDLGHYLTNPEIPCGLFAGLSSFLRMDVDSIFTNAATIVLNLQAVIIIWSAEKFQLTDFVSFPLFFLKNWDAVFVKTIL